MKKFTKERKERLEAVLATVICCFGMILIACSWFVEPRGVIDSSVLVAYGETMTFAGSLFGLNYYHKRKTAANNPEDNYGQGS